MEPIKKTASFFEAFQYMELVEFTSNVDIQNCIIAENKVISNIITTNNKIVFDIGAGYGRITSFLSAKFFQVVSIDIEPKMYKVLKIRSSQFKNCYSYNIDYRVLNYRAKEEKERVFIFAQNTFGTLGQNVIQFTDTLNDILKQGDELIITFFIAHTLPSTGLSVYNSLKDMVGVIDMGKSDLENGDFYSKTDYYSKWITTEELNFFVTCLNFNSIIQNIEGSFFKIIHFKI